MLYTLANQFLTVKINSKGAELNSIKDRDNNERLWQANPDVWGRHAPVLFPIVGKVMNNKYSLDGKEYSLGQHGFARDMEFHKVLESDDQITLELDSNSETKEKYPYDFKFQVEYRILKDTISINLRVINDQNSKIWFSVGAHPGFKIPVLDDENYSDYQLSFLPAKNYEQIPLVNSYIDPKDAHSRDLAKPIDLSHDLFKDDAQIFKLNGQATTISIVNPSNDKGIELFVDKAPYVGVWSQYPKTGNFVCIEPWWGLADDVNSDGNYKSKVAIQELEPKKEFNASFSIKIK